MLAAARALSVSAAGAKQQTRLHSVAAVNQRDRQTDRQTDGWTPDRYLNTYCVVCGLSLQCFDAVGWATGRASGL